MGREGKPTRVLADEHAGLTVGSVCQTRHGAPDNHAIRQALASPQGRLNAQMKPIEHLSWLHAYR
eukprot:531950-Amphidinium_carterae.1